MRYKTKEVEQHRVKYRVFDKEQRKFCSEFEDLYDAIVYCEVNADVKHWDIPKISHTLKTESEYSVINAGYEIVDGIVRRTFQVTGYPAAKFVILTDLGDVVGEEEIDEARKLNRVWKNGRWGPEWEEYCYQRDSRLVCSRGSPKKIKQTYRKFYKGFGRWGHNFSRVIRSYYRHPRTHGEIKQACAHADEYGEQIVRAKRRYKNVPDAWDDYCSDVYHTEKSWKHNSKRRRQWVPK